MVLVSYIFLRRCLSIQVSQGPLAALPIPLPHFSLIKHRLASLALSPLKHSLYLKLINIYNFYSSWPNLYASLVWMFVGI
jgi:hypothetical protein